MNIKYPCGICHKAVGKNHNAVCCDVCDEWVHIGCNKITKYCYRKLKKDNFKWYCKSCIKNNLPFSELTDIQLGKIFSNNLLVSPKILIKQNQLRDIENAVESLSNTITPEEFNEMNLIPHQNNLYLHNNISSLSYHIDELKSLIENLKIKPKIIGISETKINKKTPPLAI